MLHLYYLKCRRKTESKNPKFVKTNKGRKMLSSKCAVCDSKKSGFIKKQEAEGLLNMIDKILLLGPLLT